ncbi:MAG: DEAD/DEAH box helicase [Planctomycetes bacterium]|nr:DEAD/DEAH box helicase [Planctomycetota bacterium]
MTTKPRHRLSLKDRLSRLTFTQACKYLGKEGRPLIQQGGQWEIDLDEQVYLRGDLFRLKLPEAVVTITLMASAKNRLHWNCTACEFPCEHAGAAFSLILEEKTALGLAAPPPERVPVESLSEQELVEQALADREERALKEKFRLQSTDPKKPWTDYSITSAASGKTYRVALRSTQRGVSYCSCPDFRTNTLGTCKHIIYALRRTVAKFSAKELQRPYRRKHLSVHLTSGEKLALRLGIPKRLDEQAQKIINPIADRDLNDVHDLIRRIAQLEKTGQRVNVYPDAEEFIQQRLFQQRIQKLVSEIRSDPAKHPLRTQLLKAELLPYQLDGIAFSVGAGRAVLADDMGLGKTIQGIGVAELLAREAGVRKVLVICPTSLKSQWRNEIERFSDHSCQLVLGSAVERAEQYDNEEFFTVCNYEQVLRDLPAIERVKWDLIILDEAQRIKNWEAKTTNTVKRLKSRFALVLSGTPLENRLDDLYSVVQFVDDRRLGPAFRFLNRHRVVDERGKVLGYKNLDQLREKLQPILLRRTRADVLKQLPERTTEIVRIAPTGEQAAIHDGNMRIVVQIVRKPYISEMDLLRLRQALLMCRMAADSTYLCNKQQPAFSSKLQRIDELLERVFAEPGRKALLFSEWTTMLDLIEETLQRQGLDYVRLDGSVPQKKRQQLVNRFQNHPECQLFLSTNAGSTGLNLQAADTVINVDLPWNPAVLEQRIARAHRMGQKRPVQVYLLVTEETLEESLLGTLSAKKDLALAALDVESEVDEVSLVSSAEELKSRLEILLGAKPEAAADIQEPAPARALSTGHQERVAAAGGEMLGAVFNFLGELVAQNDQTPAPPTALVDNLKQRLGDCVTEDQSGRQRLSITLPDRQALDHLAETLAHLLVTQSSEEN